MAFTYIQCKYCGRTRHFSNYPELEHKTIKRDGVGICRGCEHKPSVGSLFAEHGLPFIDYLMEHSVEQK